MTKRLLATFLWFYTGWYAGALFADFLGLTTLLVPILGAAAAAVFAGDPRRLIWTAREVKSATASTPEPTAEPA